MSCDSRDPSPHKVTPRLPPEVVKAGSSARKGRSIVIGLILGAASGFFAARWGMDFLQMEAVHWSAKIALVLATPLLWLFAVAWHELGHVVGGWMVGGRFLLFVIGPFKWQRTPTGVRFGWNRRFNLAGGLAACLPLEHGNAAALPRQLAVVVAAGPMASAVLAVIAAVVAPVLADLGGSFGERVALFTALLSAVILVVTVFPSETAGFKSDGLRLWKLLRQDAHSRQEAALLALSIAQLVGVRPADNDPAQLEAALQPDDDGLNAVYAHLVAFYHAADLGEFARAQRHLDRFVASEDRLPGFMRETGRAEYAWLLATAGEDATAARAWLESAGLIEFDPATRLRAEAAVLKAEGRVTEATAKAREGLHALATRSLAPVRSPFAVDALEALARPG